MGELSVPRIRGSWVTDLPEEDLPPGDFSKLENCVYGKAGYPETRPGWRPLEKGISPGVIKHLDSFQSKIGPVLMVYTDPTTQSGSTNVPSLWAWHRPGSFDGYEISGLDKASPGLGQMSSVSANTWWVFTYNAPGDSRVLYWDGQLAEQGTTGVLVGKIRILPNAPPASKVFYENSRIWVVKPSEPSTLYGSARDNFTDWTIASNQSVRLPITPGDGGTIARIISFGGTMFVFKDDDEGGSIHQLTESLDGSGNIVFSRNALTTKVGAVSDKLVIVVEDRDVYFGSRRGLHSLAKTDRFGDVQSSRIDAEIASVWRSLSLAQKQRAIMIDDWQNERILLSYDEDNDGTNDRTIYLHYSRFGPPRLIRNQEERFPSFSKGTFGFDTGTVFTFSGNLNGTVVVARDL